MKLFPSIFLHDHVCLSAPREVVRTVGSIETAGHKSPSQSYWCWGFPERCAVSGRAFMFDKCYAVTDLLQHDCVLATVEGKSHDEMCLF